MEQEHVGYFEDIETARAAWRERKVKIIKKIAQLQKNDKIKNALISYAEEHYGKQ
jgi:hypothetical protein